MIGYVLSAGCLVRGAEFISTRASAGAASALKRYGGQGGARRAEMTWRLPVEALAKAGACQGGTRSKKGKGKRQKGKKGMNANERQRVSYASGAGPGAPASERAGGSGGAKPPGVGWTS